MATTSPVPAMPSVPLMRSAYSERLSRSLWCLAALVVSVCLGCGARQQRTTPTGHAAPAASSGSGSPAASIAHPGICPDVPTMITQTSASERPGWAAGLRARPCPGDRCLGYQSCLCDDSGRLISRTSHHDETMLFDESGRPQESRFPDRSTGRTVHVVYAYAGDCTVEAFDLDNDGWVERFCRVRSVCGPGVLCRECADVQVELLSRPCPAGVCPALYSRCGCDEKGRIIEAVRDAEHSRQTTRYDSAGRIIEEAHYRAGQRLLLQQTAYDSRGRVVEQRVIPQGPQTRTQIEWHDDGSRREVVYLDDKPQRETRVDLSQPGRETVTIRDATGTHTQTTLLRRDGGRTLRIPLSPPVTEDWLACREQNDCRVVFDRCHCDAAWIVGRSFEPQLRQHVERTCQRQQAPVPCPTVVFPVPVPRCVQGLCAAGN